MGIFARAVDAVRGASLPLEGRVAAKRSGGVISAVLGILSSNMEGFH